MALTHAWMFAGRNETLAQVPPSPLLPPSVPLLDPPLLLAAPLLLPLLLAAPLLLAVPLLLPLLLPDVPSLEPPSLAAPFPLEELEQPCAATAATIDDAPSTSKKEPRFMVKPPSDASVRGGRWARKERGMTGHPRAHEPPSVRA